MKTCSTCKVLKPKSEFTANRSKADGLQYACSACQRVYVNEHYRNNKAYYKAKAKKRAAEIMAAINALKDCPCTDCGVRYPPWVMDFDHRENEGKVDAVSRLRLKSCMSNILAEIAKCDVVCSNCHRQRTHDRLFA